MKINRQGSANLLVHTSKPQSATMANSVAFSGNFWLQQETTACNFFLNHEYATVSQREAQVSSYTKREKAAIEATSWAARPTLVNDEISHRSNFETA
jgi:hypothetical protein